MEIKFKDLVRGNWNTDNSGNENRTFDIVAEVQITGDKKVSMIVNGRITKDGDNVGSFSQTGMVAIPAFTPQTSDAVVAIEAYQACVNFVAAVSAEAASNPPFNA